MLYIALWFIYTSFCTIRTFCKKHIFLGCAKSSKPNLASLEVLTRKNINDDLFIQVVTKMHDRGSFG